jgi:ribosomal protein S18 acetylase RimI-like enzyme
MLDWAEDRLARPIDGRRRLQVYVCDFDWTRRALLEGRGYAALDAGGWTRVVRFGSWPIPDERPAEPYRLATTSRATARRDAERMAILLNAAFGRTQHTAAEYLRFMAGSPSFSHDLNLLAVAPDGSFAAHVGVSYDPVNRFGIFEPVCTHPAHRRKGLARALMLEGLRRLRERDAVSACVDTGDIGPANALYRACGFTEEYRGHWLEREV